MGNRTKHTSVLHRRHGKRVLERALQVAGDRVCRARGLRLEALLHLEFQTVSALALLMRCQQATPAGHRCARGPRGGPNSRSPHERAQNGVRRLACVCTVRKALVKKLRTTSQCSEKPASTCSGRTAPLRARLRRMCVVCATSWSTLRGASSNNTTRSLEAAFTIGMTGAAGRVAPSWRWHRCRSGPGYHLLSGRRWLRS